MKNKFSKFDINKNIIKALDEINYKEPTNVQDIVIPKILNKKDIIIKSRTGSGKTASFSIPICESIDINKNQVQALIVVPTRELTIQVKDEISNIGRLKMIRCESIYGKQSIREQINKLKQRIHIVVSTPGRIIDLVKRECVDLSSINYLVIDEADKMLHKGFIEDMEFIINNSNQEKNIALFSATIDEDIENISSKYMKEYEKVEIKDVNENDDKIDQIEDMIIKVNNNEKYEIAKQIINKIDDNKKIIIFLNTKQDVINLHNVMRKDNIKMKCIHGDMSQEKRINIIKDFKSSKFNVLIGTDVISRGIHVDDINLVINYDVPEDRENYVHRIGRTGRKDSYGSALTLVDKNDERYINQIYEYINKDIKECSIEDVIKSVKNNYKISKKAKPIEIKKDKSIVKLYLNVGKKKKIRVLDIVGALSNVEGINNEDIGVIEVEQICSYVDILNNKAELIIKKQKHIKIKNKPVIIKKDNRN